MDGYPDVFGTTFELDKRESYCTVGEFVHRDGLVDRYTGKLNPNQFNRITKSMYWFYIYSLWVDNKSIAPLDQVNNRESFPVDMNKMLYTFFKRRFNALLTDVKMMSKFVDMDKKVMKLVYREHLLAFVNHIVGKLNKNPKSVLKLRLPSPNTANAHLSPMRRNREYIARELQMKRLTTEKVAKNEDVSDELVDSLVEKANKPMLPVIKIEKEVVTDGPVTDGQEPVMVQVKATLKRKPKASITSSTR